MDRKSINSAIAAFGPRLRGLRLERGTTLAELSELTDISVSTLSRLESGGRKATLELLLAIAHGFQMPLEELIEPPVDSDPRVDLKSFDHHGITFVPLTRRPGDIMAFKMILPPSAEHSEPTPQVHEGHEWLYVLNGTMRLVLGDKDIVLKAGEVAEFETSTPHWFANAGRKPLELLSLFGKQGERAHVRVRSGG